MEVARRTSTDTRFQVTLAEHLQVGRFVPAAHGTDRVHPKKVVGHAALRSDLRSQKS